MRPILLLCTLVLLSVGMADAQERRYTQGVLTDNTTIVTSEETQMVRVRVLRERNLTGYQQQVSAGWWMTFNESTGEDVGALRFSYIGGKRFNNYFFLGAGAGVDVGLMHTFKPMVAEGYSGVDNSYNKILEHRQYYSTQGRPGKYNELLPIQTIAIPLFVNVKSYFTATKVAPFISFSVGARFTAPKRLNIYKVHCIDELRYIVEYRSNQIKYGAVLPFFDVTFGFDCQLSQNNSLAFQIGYYTQCLRDISYYMYHYETYGLFYHGFSLSVGYVF